MIVKIDDNPINDTIPINQSQFVFAGKKIQQYFVFDETAFQKDKQQAVRFQILTVNLLR